MSSLSSPSLSLVSSAALSSDYLRCSLDSNTLPTYIRTFPSINNITHFLTRDATSPPPPPLPHLHRHNPHASRSGCAQISRHVWTTMGAGGSSRPCAADRDHPTSASVGDGGMIDIRRRVGCVVGVGFFNS